MNDDNTDLAVQLFQKLQASFPELSMKLDLEPENVQVSLEIPKQDGLLFDVSLNLQNSDELHLNAGALWQEWWSCSDQGVSQQFYDAVFGLLSGTHRIVEVHRGSTAVKAQLQRPNGSDWETVATWSCFHLPLPFGKKTVILQNAQH